MLLINPGTEAREDTSEDNAVAVAKELAKTFKNRVPNLKLTRASDRDSNDGWYGFTLSSGDKTIEVDIPGDDPEEVLAGEPFKSRRLYVDGSSWLYGFAVGIVAGELGLR